MRNSPKSTRVINNHIYIYRLDMTSTFGHRVRVQVLCAKPCSWSASFGSFESMARHEVTTTQESKKRAGHYDGSSRDRHCSGK